MPYWESPELAVAAALRVAQRLVGDRKMQPAPAAAMVSLPLANPHMTSSARHLMATLAKLQSDPSLAVPPPQPGYGSTTIVPDISAVVAAPVGAAAVTAVVHTEGS